MGLSRPLKILLLVTVVLSLGAATFVFVAHENTQPLAADKLRIYTDQLRASALSSTMLAELGESNKVTHTYFENGCMLLLQTTSQNEESLRQEQAQQPLQSLHQQTVELGAQIVANLHTLCGSLTNADRFHQSQERLKNLAQQLKALQGHL